MPADAAAGVRLLAAGLAADNFPAVVLFSSVLGMVLQSLETKALLLELLEVIRQLMARLNRLAGELVWAIGGDDAALRRYINAWLAREQARGQMEARFDHWVRLSSEGRAGWPSRPH